MKATENEIREEYDFSQARRGPIVPAASNKQRITIRLDADIINWFRESVNAKGGGSYQALINQALREHIENQENNWETAFRQIVREELELAHAMA